MAGEAIASGFIELVINQLASSALEEFRLLRGVNDELEKLSSTLSTIQAVVEDAEEKQLRDKSARDWIRKLKMVAYDVDDILDNYAAEALRLKVEGRARVRWKKVRDSLLTCYCSSEVLFRCKIARNIKAIRERLYNVVKERDSLHLREVGGTTISQLEITERPDTSSLVDDFTLFGREYDKEYIIKRLQSFEETSGGNVPILPIVGMGGLGKTALAQLVYNDERVESHFQLRMWVSVSENFDVSKLTKEILEAFGGENADGNTSIVTSMNLLQDSLKHKLRGKRFLLVLDDVWNENQEKWQRLRAPLIYGGEGSKVLVTTRNENVAKVMGASQAYGLKGLSDDDCWSLFQKYAFVDGKSDGHPELAEIGKKIVKKLKGLPLAAKALGSLLYSKLDENDWQYILKSEVWELPPERNNILPALRLSYQHLNPHLKQCFAYCSTFHKDYVFERDNLIQIWMALGFIQPQGRKRAEDIGNNYFEDLLSRSFFQHKGENYVMHDMIHDLAQSVSVNEIYRIEEEGELNIPRKTRHLSVSYYNSKLNIFEDLHKLKSLRTLLLLRGYKSKICQVPRDLFLQLRCLRVLDLHRRNITELPSSIGILKQLRYLGLTGTGIKLLPPTISRLYNLQTLKLQACFSLSELPRGITQLINLRHLEANTRLTTKIHGIGKLSCLQELEEFVVLKESGHKIRELKDMTGLHGKLCIQNLENVINEEEATEANMKNKEYLNMLELTWDEDRDMNLLDKGSDEKILNGLQAHPNLKELKIKYFGDTKFPGWMGNTSMSNLHSICLSKCRKCEFLPPLGQLPFLRYLELEGMHGVRQVGREFYGEGATKGFPSLEELVVEDMPCLEEWSELQEGHLFPCLREFVIDDCPNLRVLPLLPPTLTRLRISEVGLNYLPGLSGCDAMTQSLSSSPPLSSSLSSLYISDCPNLRSLQEGLLGHPLRILEDLSIRDCQELMSLPAEGFEGLISLKSLHINNCPKLASWTGDRGLPASLQKLQVSTCMDLINAMLTDFRNLNSLKHLEIADCPNLTFFPEEGLPVTLEFLGIFDCTNLKTLPAWMQKLSSLVTLIVSNCRQIPFLSDGALPINVRELYIRDCPLLKERCLKNQGKDWPKIAHIPSIEVDGEQIVSEIRRRKRR